MTAGSFAAALDDETRRRLMARATGDFLSAELRYSPKARTETACSR